MLKIESFIEEDACVGAQQKTLGHMPKYNQSKTTNSTENNSEIQSINKSYFKLTTMIQNHLHICSMQQINMSDVANHHKISH